MQTTILIVDDIPENISTLFHFLDANHFEVLVARDGESASSYCVLNRDMIVKKLDSRVKRYNLNFLASLKS